jgi:hypothetical protein
MNDFSTRFKENVERRTKKALKDSVDGHLSLVLEMEEEMRLSTLRKEKELEEESQRMEIQHNERIMRETKHQEKEEKLQRFVL